MELRIGATIPGLQDAVKGCKKDVNTARGGALA